MQKKWYKANLIAKEKPAYLKNHSADTKNNNESKEVYIHWKGHDRRLDCWISADNIKPYSPIEDNDSDYIDDIESQEHENVDSAYLLKHIENTKFKTISNIYFDNSIISCWYFSPYPHKYQSCKTLYICEFCIFYFKNQFELSRHRLRCTARHPPGNEIYRDNALSIWEVDGNFCKTYCQNLCFLSKLFLDHKTLKHPVSLFLFYVLTEFRFDGYHIIGYYSKEKYSRNNLSCILVLPHVQQKGYGKYLINFSYALSIKEGVRGTPERPFSDLGRISYYRYWEQNILKALKNCKKFTATELADKLCFNVNDIQTIFNLYNQIIVDPVTKKLLLFIPNEYKKYLKNSLNTNCRPVSNEKLHWVPYDTFLTAYEYNHE